ncbi:hypothetical protein C4K24_4523 [Pseudomonas chlororaphis subsp. aurantiaca]|nr:hypothetical protein C4K24_4523 [Pseudomonas chlororaphis subsp. aurantiaca]
MLSTRLVLKAGLILEIEAQRHADVEKQHPAYLRYKKLVDEAIW